LSSRARGRLRIAPLEVVLIRLLTIAAVATAVLA